MRRLALLLALAGALTLAHAAPADAAARSCDLRGASEGPTDYRAFLRPAGELTAAVLFVDFPDAPAGDASPQALEAEIVTPARERLALLSHGRLRLGAVAHHAWLRMPRPSSAYGFDELTYERHERYIADAVALADPFVDFSAVDLVYVVAARGSALELSPAFLGGPGSAVVADGRRVGWAATFGEDALSGDGYGAHVAVHETLHLFGLPDLYVDGAGYPALHRNVGAWDVMGWIGPGLGLTAWHQRKLGWLGRRSMACVTRRGTRTYRLRPAAGSRGLRAVAIPVSRSRAYVVESRQRVGSDAGVCFPGVLAYLVDARSPSGRAPIRVLPAGRRDVEPCGPLADATYSRGRGRRSVVRVRRAGLTVRVLSDSASGSRVRVTLAGRRR